jgi:CDP-diacylglycerol--glycerol-3-phosphate 3-phosphatidyltransferase
MAAAIAVTVVTGVDYAVQGWRLRRAARPAAPGATAA